eukprot:TRINITY_DN4046_c2_g1_i1.p3 TRINITY_DN4046_c2_g1~~TRINITY_DN4046_c2_g1_i1.p3  ORF type:complete len:118 (+),score=1.37 TRINITY_DN4046_c2_g1_i1:331-684(+)
MKQFLMIINLKILSCIQYCSKISSKTSHKKPLQCKADLNDNQSKEHLSKITIQPSSQKSLYSKTVLNDHQSKEHRSKIVNLQNYVFQKLSKSHLKKSNFIDENNKKFGDLFPYQIKT